MLKKIEIALFFFMIYSTLVILISMCLQNVYLCFGAFVVFLASAITLIIRLKK